MAAQFLRGSIMLKRLEEDGAAHGGDASPAAADSTQEGLPKKVLVAEDNVVSQQVVRRLLEAMGCNVMVVEDGAAAVDACARQEFGLVLMDLQMPKLDGIQATQEIRRQERPGRHVPILALTAKSASDELARCTAAGMNGLLTKPLEIARLRQTLDRFGLARWTLEVPAPTAAAPDGQAGEPVDLLTLHAKFSGDTVFVRRLCQTFVTTTGQGLEELDGAVAAGERTRVRLLAHKIKAAGSGVYAHRLAAIAANIESEAMTAAMPVLVAAVETLRRAFDEATLHIGSRLA
jgi:CheY-like chemotaxis protein/HPt (histidine-containing phosphotransfer) domain-containing protein